MQPSLHHPFLAKTPGDAMQATIDRPVIMGEKTRLMRVKQRGNVLLNRHRRQPHCHVVEAFAQAFA
jgi:hypothetical protein